MKWFLYAIGALALLVALLAIIGSFLPREHRATCRATFRASAETLFAALSDIDGLAAWRPELKSVRRIDPIAGKPAFVEETKQGKITYAIEESTPSQKLVLRIADDSLPYGGTWTFALAPSANGTTLAITEDGFVKNVIFRTLARFVFGYHATMEGYLANLARKCSETVVVERVE